MNKILNGPWFLNDLDKVDINGLNVFSCFHCGGGSTMGYKLAGFNVLGGVEIDPEMMKIYRANHSPKLSYLMGVQDFKNIPNDQIPAELFDLDILDGSPPCSSFSMAGSREDAWGDKKKFREGQAEQVLDDLFFDFIDVAKKLKPKVVVAENVKGLMIGKAKGYVKQIFNRFNDEGYDVQLFLLNAAFMGVPQKRERTFFIARRKDLSLEKLKLNFNERPISVEASFKDVSDKAQPLTKERTKLWDLVQYGQRFNTVHKKGSDFGTWKLHPKEPSPTILSRGSAGPTHWQEARWLSRLEYSRIQTFPDDYNFLNQQPQYVTGMSVPPFMMQRVANQIAHQLFGKKELKHG